MKRFHVKIRKTVGKGFRILRPSWAKKVKGRLSYKRAKALEAALEKQNRYDEDDVKVREAKPVKKRTPKYSWVRAAIRNEASRRGLTHTSGDRDYNSLASVGRVSDHWDEVDASWADDYWHKDTSVMEKFARDVQQQYNLKQVLVHDAGSGNHVHIAGWATGFPRS